MLRKFPKSIQTLKLFSKKKNNNDLACQFVFKKNPEIAKCHPSYSTLQEQYNFLSLILMKQCFNLNYKEIIDKINHLAQPSGLFYKAKSDLTNYGTIITLLNILTDREIGNNTNINDFEIVTESFTKANIPIIIDKTSLEYQNQFIFFIQIEIIFDIFKDKINQILSSKSISNDFQINPTIQKENEEQKLNREKNQKKHSDSQYDAIDTIEKYLHTNPAKKEINQNHDIKKQELIENALLKTLNTIGLSAGLHFENFIEAIRLSNLPKFVKHLLKDDKESQQILGKIADIEIDDHQFKQTTLSRINSVLDYLSKKDARFETLLLNFDNPAYFEQTSINFYQNLLDSFFLKNTKEELFERCYTILFGKFCPSDKHFIEYNDKKRILDKWETYLSLILFVSQGKVILDEDFLSKNEHFIVNCSDIPLIIDSKFTGYLGIYELGSHIYYYQLQFIFNELDQNPRSKLIEYFLIATRKINQIKIPPYEQILKSVRAKNISHILQIRRQKNRSKKKKQDSPKIATKIACSNDKKESLKPLKYIDRKTSKINNISKQKEEEMDLSQKFGDFRPYWYNDDQKILIFEKGFFIDIKLYQRINGKPDHNFENQISYFQKKVKKANRKSLPIPRIEFNTKNDTEIKIYKLLYYDIESIEWKLNNDALNELTIDHPEIMNNSIKTPLICLYNSNENESIKFCEKIFQRPFSKINENDINISVYAFLCSSLSDLNFPCDSLKDSTLIYPIFLILHFPNGTKPSFNFNGLIFQIHTFLLTISDISIILLNKYFSDGQINGYNYDNIFIKTCRLKSDDIELEEDIEFFEEEEFIHFDEKYNFGDKLNVNNINTLFDNYRDNWPNLFLLYNDERICYTQNDVLPKKTKCANYINIDDPITYLSFLNSFNKFLKKRMLKLSTFEHFKRKCEFFPYFRMSSFYISNRFKNDIILYDKIIQRYKEMESYNVIKADGFHLVKTLHKELSKTFPPFDHKYASICNKILGHLNLEISHENSGIIEKELLISSENNLKYLERIINSELYWNDEEMDNLQKGHNNFLKEEFFSIIKDHYLPDKIPTIYADNENILSEQIEKDTEIIIKFFDEFKKKIEKKKQERLIEIEEGTNYMIKERENEREIKVRVEINGDIDDLIPPDS